MWSPPQQPRWSQERRSRGPRRPTARGSHRFVPTGRVTIAPASKAGLVRHESIASGAAIHSTTSTRESHRTPFGRGRRGDDGHLQFAPVTSRGVRRAQQRRDRSDARVSAFVAAAVVGFALVLYGAPVPRLSEELYLPLVRHTGDADIPRRRLDDARALRRALGLRPPVGTRRRGDSADLVRLDRTPRVLVDPRGAARSARPALRARPTARGRRDRALARRQPVAHRLRLDVRDLRSQEPRVLLPRRRAARGHLATGAGRGCVARPRRILPSRSRRLGRARGRHRAAARRGDPIASAPMVAARPPPRPARRAGRRHRRREHATGTPAVPRARGDSPSCRPVLRRIAAPRAPDGRPDRCAVRDADRQHRLVPGVGPVRPPTIPPRVPARGHGFGSDRVHRARGARLAVPDAATAATRAARGSALLLLPARGTDPTPVRRGGRRVPRMVAATIGRCSRRSGSSAQRS